MTGLALSLSFLGEDDRIRVSLRSPFERSSGLGVGPFGAESDAFGVCVTRIAVRLGSLLPRLDELVFSPETNALCPPRAVVEERRELLSTAKDDRRDSDGAAACIEPVDPRLAASSGDIVLIALRGIFTTGLDGPPDIGLGVGSSLKPDANSPRFMLGRFLFLWRSWSIFLSQIALLVNISSTAKRIAGNMSVTASNSGLAKMFMKPI